MIAVVNKKNHTPTANDVFIGRGSALGNPYTSIPAIKETRAEFRCATREESLQKFNEHIQQKIKDKDKVVCDELNRIWKMVRSGHNVNLVCYCVPSPCHGNIIKKIIESKLHTHKTYSGSLPELRENQILVFGSNTEGRHGKGVALIAKEKYGAVYGQARGLQGKSYAIITKDLTKTSHPSRTPEQIKSEIKALYDFASWSPAYEFIIPYTSNASNLNAYSSQEMAEFFSEEKIPNNIVFEEEFYKLIKHGLKK